MPASAERRSGPSPLSALGAAGSNRAQAVGTTVMAISIEARMDAEIAMAMSE